MAPSPRLLGCSGDRETWTGPSRPPVSSIGRFSSSPPDFLTPWFRADSNEAADFSSPLASLAALLRWVSLDEAADSSPPLASLAALLRWVSLDEAADSSPPLASLAALLRWVSLDEAADSSPPLASLAALLRWVSLDEAADSSPPLASLAAVWSSCSFRVEAVGFSSPLVVATGRPPSLDDLDDGAGLSPERCGLWATAGLEKSSPCDLSTGPPGGWPTPRSFG